MEKLTFDSEQPTDEDIQAYANSSHGSEGTEAFNFLATLQN